MNRHDPWLMLQIALQDSSGQVHLLFSKASPTYAFYVIRNPGVMEQLMDTCVREKVSYCSGNYVTIDMTETIHPNGDFHRGNDQPARCIIENKQLGQVVTLEWYRRGAKRIRKEGKPWQIRYIIGLNKLEYYMVRRIETWSPAVYMRDQLRTISKRKSVYRDQTGKSFELLLLGEEDWVEKEYLCDL